MHWRHMKGKLVSFMVLLHISDLSQLHPYTHSPAPKPAKAAASGTTPSMYP